MRHGLDADHLVAISNLTGANDRRAGLRAATAYALGHGVLVLGLGFLVVLSGYVIPDSLDALLGRLVGVTLIVLGVSIALGLARDRRQFRLRSRWMVLGSGTASAGRWARDRVVRIRHEHPHHHEGHGHGHAHRTLGTAEVVEPSGRGTKVGHSHEHEHVAIQPRDPFATTKTSGALVIGILHGIGAETPTQIALLIAASQAAGQVQAIVVLVAFVLGLLCANTAVALAMSSGYLSATRNFAVYMTLALLSATVSIAVGLVYVFDSPLPAWMSL
jgi:high-affinity nickel-transport protein